MVVEVVMITDTVEMLILVLLVLAVEVMMVVSVLILMDRSSSSASNWSSDERVNRGGSGRNSIHASSCLFKK